MDRVIAFQVCLNLRHFHSNFCFSITFACIFWHVPFIVRKNYLYSLIALFNGFQTVVVTCRYFIYWHSYRLSGLGSLKKKKINDRECSETDFGFGLRSLAQLFAKLQHFEVSHYKRVSSLMGVTFTRIFTHVPLSIWKKCLHGLISLFRGFHAIVVFFPCVIYWSSYSHLNSVWITLFSRISQVSLSERFHLFVCLSVHRASSGRNFDRIIPKIYEDM